VLDGIASTALTHRVDVAANPVAWLVWHTARVQDDHVTRLAATDQAWHADGWADRFDLGLEPDDIGYGHDRDQVAALDAATPELLTSYHEAVHRRTLAYLERVDADELGRVVDQGWDPPVTASMRLVSVVGDCLQHLGQAAYVRGIAERVTGG
jgi:hypothetical protein